MFQCGKVVSRFAWPHWRAGHCRLSLAGVELVNHLLPWTGTFDRNNCFLLAGSL